MAILPVAAAAVLIFAVFGVDSADQKPCTKLGIDIPDQFFPGQKTQPPNNPYYPNIPGYPQYPGFPQMMGFPPQARKKRDLQGRKFFEIMCMDGTEQKTTTTTAKPNAPPPPNPNPYPYPYPYPYPFPQMPQGR